MNRTENFKTSNKSRFFYLIKVDNNKTFYMQEQIQMITKTSTIKTFNLFIIKSRNFTTAVQMKLHTYCLHAAAGTLKSSCQVRHSLI